VRTCSWGQGGDCASPAAGTGRGRSGRSGELVSALLCTKGRESGWGYCSQFKGEVGELEGEEDATAAELGNGGGSGGAPVWSRCGSHGEASGLRAAALAIDDRVHHGSVLKESNGSN
jgi:hypothetical protein